MVVARRRIESSAVLNTGSSELHAFGLRNRSRALAFDTSVRTEVQRVVLGKNEVMSKPMSLIVE